MSPSPLGSGVLSPRPPAWRGCLQVRRCDSRQNLGLKPFVSSQLCGVRKASVRPSQSAGWRGSSQVAGTGSAAPPRVRESGPETRVSATRPSMRAALNPAAAARAGLSGSGSGETRLGPAGIHDPRSHTRCNTHTRRSVHYSAVCPSASRTGFVDLVLSRGASGRGVAAKPSGKWSPGAPVGVAKRHFVQRPESSSSEVKRAGALPAGFNLKTCHSSKKILKVLKVLLQKDKKIIIIK